MAWPQATDYFEAIQTPRVAFRDPDLKAGEPAVNAIGLPMPCSGNFADVYQIRLGERSWAVKCFTRAAAGLQERYQRLHAFLEQAKPAFTVDFCYLEQGIRINRKWFPVLKMRWVEGMTLREFVKAYADHPKALVGLAQFWVRLSRELRAAKVAHGDLQHGNVLLVPGSTARSLRLKLVDYDGMFVPTLADMKSSEVGHPAYQHPQRLRQGLYGADVDRFSHLVIYCALLGLAARGRDLWDRYDNGDNLLFCEEDFAAPAASLLLQELWKLADAPAARTMAGHLILACHAALEAIPVLDDVVVNGQARALTAEQERRVRKYLAATPAKERVPATVPAPAGATASPTAASHWWENAEPLAFPPPVPASRPAPARPKETNPVERYKRNPPR